MILVLSANTLSDNGFREHSQSRSSNFNILSNVKLSENININLVINYFNAPYLLNPSSLNKEDALNRPTWVRPFVINQGSGKKVEQGQGGITVKYQKEEKSLETTVYGIYRNLLNPVPGRIINVNRTGGGLRSLYVTPLEIFGTRIIGVVGGDLEYQSDNRKEYENDGVDYSIGDSSDPNEIFKMLRFGGKLLEQDESIIGLGLFAKMEIELPSDFFVSAGLRYDNNNFQVKDLLVSKSPQNSTGINMNQFSPMLGLSYKLNRQFNLFANYSTAFQTPTMNEMGNSPQAIYGFNKELKPETFQNIELGMRSYLINYSLFTNLTLYRLKIKNMLVPYQNPNTEGEETYYRNAGEATNYGAELSTEWIYSKHLKSNLSVSLSDFRYDDLLVEYPENDSLKIAQLSGNKVPGIPEFRFSAGLKFLLTPFSGEVYFRYVNKYFTNDFNGSESVQDSDNWGYWNDGYYTVDFYFNFEESIKVGKLFIFSGINNIFNVRYNASIIPNASGQRFFEPSSSRYWFFGIRFSFGD